MKVLVIENAPSAPVGLFGTWLEQVRGATLDVVSPQTMPDAQGEADLSAWDLIVTLGSPHGAYEDIPWIHRQRRFLQQAIAAGRPVLGICFGAQIVATAIGGRAAPFGRRFAGWLDVAETTDPVWRGPWARWHGDHLEVPEGTEVLARDQGTIQAFHHRAPGGGAAVGVQFHPEIDAAGMHVIGAKLPDWLAENNLDLDTLDRQSAANMAPRQAARHALFTEILRRAGVPPT